MNDAEPTFGGFTVRELRKSIASRGRAVRALPDLLDTIDALEKMLIQSSRELGQAKGLLDVADSYIGLCRHRHRSHNDEQAERELDDWRRATAQVTKPATGPYRHSWQGGES